MGLDVRLHFLHKEAATAYLPSWGTANTPLGYDADGALSNIAFPTELPATIGTNDQVLTVVSNAVAWADATGGSGGAAILEFSLGNDYAASAIVRYQGHPVPRPRSYHRRRHYPPLSQRLGALSPPTASKTSVK